MLHLVLLQAPNKVHCHAPVPWFAITEVLDLPELSLEHGIPLDDNELILKHRQFNIPRIRQRAFILVLEEGRRSGHVHELDVRDVSFQRINLPCGSHYYLMRMEYANGKTDDNHFGLQTVTSLVYKSQMCRVAMAKQAARDVVLVNMLLAYLLNLTSLVSWTEFVANPALDSTVRREQPWFVNTDERGIPTGSRWPLESARTITQALFLRAGYYMSCHGELLTVHLLTICMCQNVLI